MRISSFRQRPGSQNSQLRSAAIFVSAALAAGGLAPGASATEEPPAPPLPRHPIEAVRPDPPKAGEYRLAYKFRANEDVHLPLSVDAKIQLKKGPIEQISSNHSMVDRHFHVASVGADGSAVVELFIDNVELSYSFNNGTPVVFNAKTKGSQPPGFQGVQNCLGPRGRIHFSNQGVVLPLQGAILDPSGDPSESFLDLLPTRPVHIGDEWSDDFKVKLAVDRNLTQKVTLRRRYTLQSVKGNIATIGLRIVEITPVQDPQLRAQLVQRTPEGTITFDIERGVTTSRELTCSRTETGFMSGEGMIAATTHIKETLR
jgi:hypothetical protein